MSDERRCSRCYSYVPRGNTACASCGQAVEAPTAPPAKWFQSAEAPSAPAPAAPPPARPGGSTPVPEVILAAEVKRSWFTPPVAYAPGAPAAEGPPPAPTGPPLPADALDLDLQWGRVSRAVTVKPGGCTIGSDVQADITLPAPFLDPIHARVRREGEYWIVESASPTGFVLHRGAEVAKGWLADGEVFRLADRSGNYVSLKVARSRQSSGRPNNLRGPLPQAGYTLVIGSAPGSNVRLEHPLVRPRHAMLGADGSGLWIEDRVTVSGTYVNGQRLRGREALKRDDVIQVGPFSARIATTTLEPMDKVAGIDVRVIDGAVEVPIKDKPPKVLLHDVQLHLRPGSLTAVAGPSGAGKTTLMRMLSGQAAASRGAVEYNRVDLKQCRAAYAGLMGFVPQDDVVHPDLTVDEALGFQAQLRLGKDADVATRKHQIDKAVGFVGLNDQRGQQVKTLSGGQRKRVSIATELLNDPEILFLDEPTSGLDPGLDKRMMLLLRLLADQGRTVVLTTHAISHVDVCDNLILVGPGGNVIYAGEPEQALPWFDVQTLGDAFGLWETKDEAEQYAARLRQEAPNRSFLSAAISGTTGAVPAVRPVPAAPAPLPAAGISSWRTSGISTTGGLSRWLQPVAEEPLPAIPNAVPKPAFGSPAWREVLLYQGRIFSERYVLLVTRDRTALMYSLLQGAIVALLLALVSHPHTFDWAGLPKGGGDQIFGGPRIPSSGALSNAGTTAFVLGTSGVWFGMINGVRELVKERTIWRREALVGASVSGYLASKVVVLGTLAAIQAFSSVAVLGAILGLDTHGPVGMPLVTMGLSAWLANMAGIALALFLSAVTTSSDRAMSLVPYLLITQVVLCGALFSLGALTFISWVMPARWAVAAIGGIGGIGVSVQHAKEFNDQAGGGGIASSTLDKLGIYPHNFAGLFLDWFVLALIIVGGIALTGRALSRQARAWSVG